MTPSSPETRRRRGRPPKLGRDAPDTRAALIRAGTEVLTEQGFTASGIDGILKRVGVPKGSFYYYFDSKEAFGRAVMAHYGAYFAGKLDRHLLDTTLTPLARLAAFVEDAKAGMAKHDFRRGCLVGNLGQEAPGLPASYRDWLLETLADWQRRLARCLREAQSVGELAADADCDTLAEAFWIGWEGAVMRARLAGRVDPLDTFITTYLQGLPR
ncbi:TetR/AcrR family transcriptional repressor of nem operon [Halomonas fontilapidosi]|uniref:TetR/AcrR family transcriptional repressor of nem operon n=1 Tax=Halomonas fontilapidosi TaxID=616675 RepID=A0A7W5GYX9_9GAMM|nr:TetR/AcrR family transcriptional regulator [Halomonas fontilapidosi]MBB3183737.1 TetR/AcrR family transcriptional repressor of nem operon [Halomonas fontilapidosi]